MSSAALARLSSTGGLLIGGPLVMAGAVLPWLTLYAGLHSYGGLTGSFGWIALALGAAAFAGGIAALRAYPAWLGPAALCFGTVVLAFAVWLAVGLRDTLSNPSMMMFVPRPGIGLFTVLVGASFIVAASLVSTLCRAVVRTSP